jgi:hypothetical protein
MSPGICRLVWLGSQWSPNGRFLDEGIETIGFPRRQPWKEAPRSVSVAVFAALALRLGPHMVRLRTLR